LGKFCASPVERARNSIAHRYTSSFWKLSITYRSAECTSRLRHFVAVAVAVNVNVNVNVKFYSIISNETWH
jgi:hypothetical protein